MSHSLRLRRFIIRALEGNLRTLRVEFLVFFVAASAGVTPVAAQEVLSLQRIEEPAVPVVAGAEDRGRIGLDMNLKLLDKINPAISNFGDATDLEVYRRSILWQVQAEADFYGARYHLAYRNLQKSQLLLIQLYERIVEQQRLKENAALIGLAGRVLNEKQPPHVKRWLQKGLREVELCRRLVLAEQNVNPPTNYTNRLLKLADAFERSRHATRYRILVHIRLNSFTQPENPAHVKYDEVQRLLFNAGITEDRDALLLDHADSYFEFGRGKGSAFDRFWDELDFSKLQEPPPENIVEKPEDVQRYDHEVLRPGVYSPRRLVPD